MNKVLAAYFSASGTTGRLAATLAEAVSADLFQIQPEIPYLPADLNWMDSSSRSTGEMNDPAARPAVKGTPDNMDAYDTVLVGDPLWRYTAPRIINTFLESCALDGSGFGGTNKDLLPV